MPDSPRRQDLVRDLGARLQRGQGVVTVGGSARCGTSRAISNAVRGIGRPLRISSGAEAAKALLTEAATAPGPTIWVCDDLSDADADDLRVPASRLDAPVVLAGRLTNPDVAIWPMTPGELAGACVLDAAEAIEAYLITGGLPLPVDRWRRGQGVWEHLAEAVDDPTSALVVNGERLVRDLPPSSLARTVLDAVAGGAATFTRIGKDAGGLKPGSVDRGLRELTDRRLVVADHPLSNRPGGDARYRVADPGLGFWLRFLGPGLPRIERGAGAEVLTDIRRGWSRWLPGVLLPLVRTAVGRLVPVDAVGGFWRRSAASDVDLIVTDARPARRVLAIGAIRWDDEPFGAADLARLARLRRTVPGGTTSTPLIAVSRSGVAVDGVTAFGPGDLVTALG